jgi:hypothetical protein
MYGDVPTAASAAVMLCGLFDSGEVRELDEPEAMAGKPGA